jgi:pyruvate formate lyase activating enzyme
MRLLNVQHMVKIPETEGTIFKIKRFSLHDGPGIRTSVFLKGCPLNCLWCHSPEGISEEITIWYNRNICITCGQCVQSCPEKALEMVNSPEPFIKIDRMLCKVSGDCVRCCPSNAIQYTGYKSTVSAIISEVERDVVFYTASGGGVTLTGGEPLFQPGFSKEILKECKKRLIHTAIETSLFCDKDVIDLILPFVDLFIVDMKLFEPERHKLYTGKTNENIKENFSYIARMDKNILVRIPMVDNITNDDKNLNAINDFVRKTRADIGIEKINFNPLAENNYKKLGIPFLLK